MDKRIADQLHRITKSIERLTRGTCLEGIFVESSDSQDADRVAFRAIAPDGSEPFPSYAILLEGLEGWSDASLDERLFQSCSMAVQGLLNRPTSTEELVEEPASQSSEPGRELGDCDECRQLRGWTDFLRDSLFMISQQSKQLSGRKSTEDAEAFRALLRTYTQLHSDLAEITRKFSQHKRTHSLFQ
jgi:hypothetical protein